jgi:antitoxin PrlF
MSETDEGTTVAVTSKGQATIPKRFREKLRIDTPGRVRFVESEDGEVVVRPVPRPSELRGALRSEADEESERTATELLREERTRDRVETDERHDLSEEE